MLGSYSFSRRTRPYWWARHSVVKYRVTELFSWTRRVLKSWTLTCLNQLQNEIWWTWFFVEFPNNNSILKQTEYAFLPSFFFLTVYLCQCLQPGEGEVRGRLTNELGSESSGQGSSPDRGRVKDCFSVLPNQHVWRLSSCLCGLAFTWWGCCALCFWHQPTELARSFLVCSRVYFCLYGPFNCISFHKFSRQLFAFSLWSFGLISALLIFSTMYLFKGGLSQPWYHPLWLTGLKAPAN